jgi:translation initiation factor IF-1
MPNTFGGRNFKKVGKKRKSKNPNIAVPTDSGIDFHGQVLKRVGGNQIRVKIFSLNEEITATIPGKFMKKVWFNSGDYVHIQKQGNFYDVIQKIMLDNEVENAKRLQNKHSDIGEEDIFRQDVEDEDGEFDAIPESDSESDMDEFGNKINVDKKSTRGVAQSEKIMNTKITKNTVSVDKLQRKLKEKERDLNRRSFNDYSEKPASIVEKKDESTESESESDYKSESDLKSEKSEKSEDINIDDI